MDSTTKRNRFKGSGPLMMAVLVLAVYFAWPGLSSVQAWLFHGRMTGGGSICKPSGCVETTGESDGRITHGFELHCAPEDVPNNLEINDHVGGHRFHLDVLDDVFCYSDPLIDPKPPAAGFNTYVGRGTGRYDGAAGFCADWVFTDAGEPGDNDKATIRITDTPGPPSDDQDDNIVAACTGNVLLVIGPAKLTFGNHQAHKNP